MRCVRRIENQVKLLRNIEGDMVSGTWHNNNGKGMRTNANAADKRIVRRIIFEHFDYIVSEWIKFEEKKNG